MLVSLLPVCRQTELTSSCSLTKDQAVTTNRKKEKKKIRMMTRRMQIKKHKVMGRTRQRGRALRDL